MSEPCEGGCDVIKRYDDEYRCLMCFTEFEVKKEPPEYIQGILSRLDVLEGRIPRPSE